MTRVSFMQRIGISTNRYMAAVVSSVARAIASSFFSGDINTKFFIFLLIC